MIIHPRPVQSPPYNEMYAKNAENLRNTSLCPFLREMDIQEEQLQQTVNHPYTEKFKWHPNIIGTLKGAVIGATILGGLGAVIFGTYGFIESSRITVEINHYGEELNSRKNRIIKKIQLIYAHRVNLENQIERSLNDQRQIEGRLNDQRQVERSLNDRLEIIQCNEEIIQCQAGIIQLQEEIGQCQDEIIQLLHAENHFQGVLMEYMRNNFFDDRPQQEPKWNEIFYDYHLCNGITWNHTDLRTDEDKKGCRIHNSYHIWLDEGDEDENGANLQ